jgi:cupin superfamily acireductone dioxygenase involved in methionine salvage
VFIDTFVSNFDFFYTRHNQEFMCVRFFVGEKKYLPDFKSKDIIHFINLSAEGMNIA